MKLFLQLMLMILIACTANSVSAQELTQTIRGRIIDADSKSPVAFANIVVVGSQPILGANSDVDGYFRIEKVPVGRAAISISYIGYENKVIPNLVVISGKETVLDVEMKETFETLNEVTVSARQHKSEVNNEMAQVSSRSLSVEESKRYAGGIGDPARLVSFFAGVGSTGEGNNDIIVRGNNPRFIQWKLDGTEIPNPNHFSQEGLTGGPINALNSQMLANSEFYTGAFAPEYGNALSGIFDMRLRKGNSEKREHSFSIGVLGTDITTEGPFKKGGKSSYLINYRYSTLAIISSLGFLDFGGVPKYQDVSFKIFIPTEKAGTFSFFGLGGLNNIKSEYADPENEDIINEEFQQSGQLGITGVNHLINLNKNAYISSTLSYSNNGTEYSSARIYDSSALQEDQSANTNNNIFRLNTSFNYKLNNRHQFQIGSVNSHFNFNFNSRYFDSAADRFILGQDVTGTASLYQSFITWKWRASEKLSLVNGIHSQNTSQNNEITFEPRSSLRYQLPKGQAITAGIGIHSNMSSLSNYYTIVYDTEGNKTTPNSSLKLLKARHYVMGYENKLSKNLFLKVEGYYQDLYDIPMEKGNSSYSLVNQTYEFSDRILVNEGKGRNIGLELTLERYFSNNYYFLITGSLFDSKYKASDDKWRDTRFNGNYIANGLFGKEFTVGKNNNNILGINSKLSLLGARRIMEVDLDKSVEEGTAVYDELNAFAKRGEDIFSLNIAINYRINKPQVSHEFKIDIQNITNNTSVIDYYYNDVNKSIEEVEQLPMLPVLSYTLNF
ncbi:TonB-dependent receptor [Marivirga lumbricoides]|uniref:TonB-dependent receptor n=1 Tax=Marivirga lumbricoides TaxID=1046115 RepID=A0A2T4DPR8_9BACT|nr:TonB-dependent receptor [Marivirga lumbricoides]